MFLNVGMVQHFLPLTLYTKVSFIHLFLRIISVSCTLSIPLFTALQDLQGKVELYFLTANSIQESQTLQLDPTVTSVLISDLQPNTEYTFSLTLSNGAHNITSPEVTCATADGGELKEIGSPV